LFGVEIFVEVDNDGSTGETVDTCSVNFFRCSATDIARDNAAIHAGFDGDSGFVLPELANGDADLVVKDVGGGNRTVR